MASAAAFATRVTIARFNLTVRNADCRAKRPPTTRVGRVLAAMLRCRSSHGRQPAKRNNIGSALIQPLVHVGAMICWSGSARHAVSSRKSAYIEFLRISIRRDSRDASPQSGSGAAKRAPPALKPPARRGSARWIAPARCAQIPQSSGSGLKPQAWNPKLSCPLRHDVDQG